MYLVPDQGLHAMVLRESGKDFFLVHPYAFDEIVGHSNIQCAVTATGKNVDVEAHALGSEFLALDSRLRGNERSLIPRKPLDPKWRDRRTRLPRGDQLRDDQPDRRGELESVAGKSERVHQALRRR